MSRIDHDVDDPGSGAGIDDAADTGLDLTPRTTGGTRPRSRRKANPALWVLVGVIVAGIGFVVWNGLSGATLYFRNVDEAIAQQDELGTRRFRLQGLVVDDPVTEGDLVTFEVTFNDATLPVRSTAGLPALFEPGRPVVMEGRFAEGDELVYEADHVFVKHDEVYEADNEDRIVDAEDGQSGG
jgi:cytochrome c-type biogenesis protein CcmE